VDLPPQSFLDSMNPSCVSAGYPTSLSSQDSGTVPIPSGPTCEETCGDVREITHHGRSSAMPELQWRCLLVGVVQCMHATDECSGLILAPLSFLEDHVIPMCEAAGYPTSLSSSTVLLEQEGSGGSLDTILAWSAMFDDQPPPPAACEETCPGRVEILSQASTMPELQWRCLMTGVLGCMNAAEDCSSVNLPPQSFVDRLIPSCVSAGYPTSLSSQDSGTVPMPSGPTCEETCGDGREIEHHGRSSAMPELQWRCLLVGVMQCMHATDECSGRPMAPLSFLEDQVIPMCEAAGYPMSAN